MDRAERHFREAVRANPKHLEANQELRLIEMRKKKPPPRRACSARAPARAAVPLAVVGRGPATVDMPADAHPDHPATPRCRSAADRRERQ